MATGTIKWFDPRKGFGFILPDGGSTDVFVHHSSIVGDKSWCNLMARDIVGFDLHHSPRGPHARNVRKRS